LREGKKEPSLHEKLRSCPGKESWPFSWKVISWSSRTWGKANRKTSQEDPRPRSHSSSESPEVREKVFGEGHLKGGGGKPRVNRARKRRWQRFHWLKRRKRFPPFRGERLLSPVRGEKWWGKRMSRSTSSKTNFAHLVEKKLPFRRCVGEKGKNLVYSSRRNRGSLEKGFGAPAEEKGKVGICRGGKSRSRPSSKKTIGGGARGIDKRRMSRVGTSPSGGRKGAASLIIYRTKNASMSLTSERGKKTGPYLSHTKKERVCPLVHDP